MSYRINTYFYHDQCDQILLSLVANFVAKVTQKSGDLLGYFEKVATFGATLGAIFGNIGQFLFQH